MSGPAYYADNAVTLYLGDFREVLPTLDVRADLVIADPPYGETSLDWDRWPDGWPSALAACGTRSMWCFGSLRMFLDRRDEFADWKLSQDIVWEKQNGSGFATDRFKRVHELGAHWYRGSWRDVHHQTPREPFQGEDRSGRVKRYAGRSPAGKSELAHTGKIDSNPYTARDERLVRSVMRHRNCQGSAINETEKPVSLLRALVQYGCPPGGLVIDIFAGSASTLVAARDTGRRAIGIELRESQCEQAALRLAQASLDLDIA